MLWCEDVSTAGLFHQPACEMNAGPAPRHLGLGRSVQRCP